jgi:hypothetical protein
MDEIQIENQGSLILFIPITENAKTWLQENVQEDAQWFGKALVVEPRYAGDLARGCREAGLIG